jgi:phosphopantetheinyl transferase (holo-ACP synthase)
VIEIMRSAPTSRAAAYWRRDGEALHEWFTPLEIDALRARRNRDAATIVRVLAKRAVCSALRRAGLRRVPCPIELQIAVEPGGRPWVEMPDTCARWLAARGLGLDVSLSHARGRALAVAVLA